MTIFSRSTTAKSATRMLCAVCSVLNRTNRKNTSPLANEETVKSKTEMEACAAMIYGSLRWLASSEKFLVVNTPVTEKFLLEKFAGSMNLETS